MMGSLSIWHILIVLFFFLPFGFLPTIIALARRHRNALAIFLVNLLTGWTLIGWIVALVWSVLSDKPAEKVAARS